MKSGFSFVVLTSTVVILLILLTSITIAGNKTMEDSKKLSFATEISTLQQAVDSYETKNNGIYPVKDSIVLDIEDLNESSKNQFMQNAEEINDNKIVLNEIDYEKIAIISLKYGNLADGENDMYALSPITGKVYYAKGMKIGSKLYFTLTDELSSALGSNVAKSKKASQSNNNLVVFSPSNINWTYENVSVDIKIPELCEMQYIFIDGESTSDYQTSKVDGYNVYTVSKEGNYNIKVKYYKKDDTKNVMTATYNVNNVDNIAPSLQIETDLVSLASNGTDTNLLGYLKIVDKKDTLSGIKTLKYENNSIFSGVITNEQKQNIKAHFENSGKIIEGTAIPIEKGCRKVTIYIEDKAGNWALQTIDIAQD